MTPEAREIAAQVSPLVDQAFGDLGAWRAAHPGIGDYRIEQTFDHLRRSRDLLDRLISGKDPEFDAALEGFRERLARDGEAPPQPPPVPPDV